MIDITQKEIKRLFNYDKETGELFWRINKGRAVLNSIAGSINNRYLSVSINRKKYLVHRIIWLFHYGYLPENTIDHINRNTFDNRLSNLREVSQMCNQRNRKLNKNNTSTVKGVYWHKQHNKWQPRINVNRKSIFLGLYEDFDNAVCARLAAEQSLNWQGCDASSPAYKYIKENIQNGQSAKLGCYIK